MDKLSVYVNKFKKCYLFVCNYSNQHEYMPVVLLVGSLIGSLLTLKENGDKNITKKWLISSILLNGYALLRQEYKKLLSQKKNKQLELTYITPEKHIQKDEYPNGIAIRKQWNDTYCWYIINYGSTGLDIGHQYIDLLSAETALIGFDKYIDKFRDINIDNKSVDNSQLYAKANYIGRIKEYLSEIDYTDFKSVLNW